MPRFDVDDYISVQARINKFWTDYPKGRIATTLHELSNLEEVIVIAEVWKNGEAPPDEYGHRYSRADVSGMAQEKKGTGGANNTSWLENAETSAIGRALANLGYATSQADRPSAEEMDKVNRATPAPARPVAVATARPAPEGEDEAARKRLMTAVILSTKQKGIADEDRKALSLSRFGKESWTELTVKELEAIKGWLPRHDRKKWTEEVVPVLKDMIDAASTEDFDAIASTVMALDLTGDDDLVAAGTRLKAKVMEVAA